MKQKVLSIFLMFAVICSFAMITEPAQASDSGILCWACIRNAGAGLSITSSGYATCTGSLTHSGSSGKVQVTLQRYQNSAWTAIKSWSDSRTGAICGVTGNYYITKGYSYRVKVSVYVYNSSGSLLESDTVYSSTKSY